MTDHSVNGGTKKGDGASTAQTPSGLSLTERVEAVLLSAERSLGDSRLAEAVSEPGEKVKVDEVKQAIEELNGQYEKTGRIFRIIRIASGWRVMTTPAAAPVLQRLLVQRQQSRLTPATLETLSIIAYRQPVMRAEIEAIRGVACGDVLRGLLERRLVRIAGRAEELGRPMLYGTTREFLKVFGLAGIDDLPEVEGLPRESSHRIAATSNKAADADDASESSEDSSEQAVPEDAESQSKATDQADVTEPA